MEGAGGEKIFIPTDEIVRSENQPIIGLDQLDQYLQKRGPLFFSILGAISMDKGSLGWDKIGRADGSFSKIDGHPDVASTFTGRALCDFASFALYDGLKEKVKDIELDVVDFYTDTNAEKWGNPDHEILPSWHVVVKATDHNTGTIRFYDPTYRQINHRVEGKIHSFGEDEINVYYRTRPGQTIDPKSILSRREELLSYRGETGLTQEKYNELVKTL